MNPNAGEVVAVVVKVCVDPLDDMAREPQAEEPFTTLNVWVAAVRPLIEVMAPAQVPSASLKQPPESWMPLAKVEVAVLLVIFKTLTLSPRSMVEEALPRPPT